MRLPDNFAAAGAPVMVLNYNGWDDTFVTLASLEVEGLTAWLIDNGSQVDRCAEALAQSPTLRVIRLPENLGWAGGYNRALEIAAAEGVRFAYILNNDALALPGAIEAAVSALAESADMAAVGSVILEGDGRRVWFDGAYHGSGNPLDVAELDRGLRGFRTLNGAGFALSVSAWVAIGPFHEPYFLYHEEVDWFVRAGAAGWKLAVEGSSLVRHSREGSDVSSNAAYYRVRNRYLALRRGVSVSGDRETWLSLTLAAFRQIRELRAEARTAAQNGLVDGVLGRFSKRSKPHPWLLLEVVTAAGLPALALRAVLLRFLSAIGRRRTASAGSSRQTS